MKINRLLSITSLNQLIIGLSCLSRNTNNVDNFNDYLIINNVLLGDPAQKSIIDIANFWPFKKIIDFRKYIAEFNDNRRCSSKINWFLGNDTKSLLNMQIKLKKLLGVNTIDQIYLRYKFGLPEHLLLCTYHKSSIYIFEDGLGDYMPYTQILIGKNRTVITKILKLIYFFKKESSLKQFEFNEKYFHRIAEKYALINDVIGHIKKQHLSINQKSDFINIKDEYVKYLFKIKNNKWPKSYIGYYNSITLCIIHDYSSISNGIFSLSIDEEISFYKEVINKIYKIYPNDKIILKMHPNAIDTVRKAYKKEFGNMIIEEINSIPAEILLLNDNIKNIVGSSSTTLIYAVNLFNKEAFFFDRPKALKRFDKYFQVEFQTLIRLGVKKL